jgi:hypothetical protein
VDGDFNGQYVTLPTHIGDEVKEIVWAERGEELLMLRTHKHVWVWRWNEVVTLLNSDSRHIGRDVPPLVSIDIHSAKGQIPMRSELSISSFHFDQSSRNLFFGTNRGNVLLSDGEKEGWTRRSIELEREKGQREGLNLYRLTILFRRISSRCLL